MTAKQTKPAPGKAPKAGPKKATQLVQSPTQPEVGGQKGPEPTRYGDWEKNGIVSDF